MSYDGAQLAVLMDLRDELKRLNTLLHCPNFTGIPETLRRIRDNTRRQLICFNHPRYRGVGKPRSDCRTCQRIYREKHS